jgi:sugar-specific transcriptional regulator TrmB
MANIFQLQQALLALNFSDKEARVYLALLDLGKGTASQIARRAGLNRSTTYVILDILASKNLVNMLGKEPKQEYTAESPQKILEYLKNQLEKDRLYIQEAEKVMPELESMHNKTDRPKVKFYEGEKGLTEVYEATLTSHEEIRGYGGVEDMRTALPKYFETYMARRAGKNIGIRAIFADTPKARELTAEDKWQKRESALVPADKYYSSPEFNVFDDKIVIVSYREKLGIIVESREIADGMKKLFDMAWQEAKRLDITKNSLKES